MSVDETKNINNQEKNVSSTEANMADDDFPSSSAARRPQGDSRQDVDDQQHYVDDAQAQEEFEETSALFDDVSASKAQEHLADLQRLQAEYVNYRRRVERDRDVARDNAVQTMVVSLLPVLDDIDAARQHGDLEEGPFAAIAQKLDDTLAKHGVHRYGEAGVAFDPTVYEALLQQPSAEVDEEVVFKVLRPGYRMGERIIRAAQVAVAVPE